MNFSKLLLLGLLVFLFSSCAKKELTINLGIKSDDIQVLYLSNVIEGIYDTLWTAESNVYTLSNINMPMILDVSGKKIRQSFFVTPGASITISDNEKGDELIFSGDNLASQQFLGEFEESLLVSEAKYGPNKIMKLEQEEFENRLAEKYTEAQDLLNDAINKGEVNNDLIQWLSNRILAGLSQAKVYYPQYYAYVNKKEVELSKDYYAFTKDFDFENKELFYFSDVRRTGESIIGHTFNYEEMESISDYYAAQYHAVSEYTKNPQLTEYFKYKLISNKINYAGGLDGMEEEINQFLSSIKVSERRNDLQAAVFEWKPLKKGLDAPNFTAFTRDGVEVQLEDLEGKNVYIDVWATWCGPCIAEIPSLKKMEEKYHEENIEFVSVSIDKESDREKWIKFIDEKSLGGTQIMAKNDWKSEVTSNYNIKGIPRFILVDSQGKIVSADAPRPSNEKNLEGLFAQILD